MALTYIDPKTGKEKTIDIAGTQAHETDFWRSLHAGGLVQNIFDAANGRNTSVYGDGYYFNNIFRTSNAEDVELAVKFIMENGYSDKDEIQKYLQDNGRVGPDSEMKEILADANTYLSSIGYDVNNMPNKPSGNPAEDALNAYYDDIYSLEEGTTGKSIYDNLLQAEQDAALSNMQLADANFQQQAMQQAQAVKNITDQVRAERVARLRAGMSESQIANQDMAMLMSNVNALNQQAADANAARLQAQQQYQNAQNTAYQAWLANANTMAQSGAAYAASDAGDIMQQALRYSQATGVPLKKAVDTLSGKQS